MIKHQEFNRDGPATPVEKQEHQRIAANLTHRAENGADAEQIADAIVSIWQQIEAALRPILGQRGVDSLYRRSLHLAGLAHPWLAGIHEGRPDALDFEALKSALVQQSSAAAAAAGGALLQTFHDLLAGLLGPALTDRLLHSVWINSPSGASAEDTIR
ncbi:hypothetical protein [Lysobacter sp. D1-1-M9]|uniref:hypothetical protein n=1 Tax=Novilysobacter longmucuonensis TaxID=3098603 RepID=UPI002FC5AF43